ncbi:hypothetical protein ASC95_21435 [Pelomonas sp. Root1217]|uniref:hypothetical protein n=1 Tax=Pelomonas sp. Root1217 TaxID=1736430 RepID=UPI00070C262B|nr:hypothetical protein [Pelomonas sp. Root1217]KQV48493.1 hypothetical protein ASC95_21435 [Pelomonas sp. Root1217]
MHRRHYVLGAATLLAGLSLPALAQRGDDDGEFVILHARYGTDRNHVDVTDRLRQLARRDRRVRLTNDLFGVDPDPGRDKYLRIYARDSQGRERRFDYPERAWIDGGQFAAWGAGRWGEPNYNGGWAGNPYRDRHDDGSYTILYANYGNPGREVDVTGRLRELARRDERFRMGNGTFGVDPDPGRDKRLIIIARDPNGQQRSFEYPEGSWVDGSQFTGWRRGDWGR